MFGGGAHSVHGSDSGIYKLVPSVELPIPHLAPGNDIATAEPVMEGSMSESMPNAGAAEEQGEYGSWHQRRQFLDSTPVQAATIIAILLNAVVMGFETDLPELLPWDAVENMFLVFFATELTARLAIIGFREYFRFSGNPDFMWNSFDFVIVMLGSVNILFQLCVGQVNAMGKDATLFRMVRLLRLLRVLRIIRIVRFLKQLYLLAYGFLEGTMAVFWVTILASFMLYICSVILVRTYGHGDYEDEEQAVFFAERFGTIPRCMFALFELISAPDLQPYELIMFRNPPLVFFLIAFIILGSFGINGLLVALINESILEKNQARIEADRIDREWKRKLMQQQCRDLFDQLDVNQNRVLPRTELMKCKGQIAKLFEVAGVNFQRNDLDQMFYIMDINDTGIIERSEFVQGVVELCDQIRPMSIMELNYQVSKCAGKIEQCDTKLEDLAKTMERYDSKIDVIGSKVRGGSPYGSQSLSSMTLPRSPEAAAAEELATLLKAAGLQWDELRSGAKASADKLSAFPRSQSAGPRGTALSPLHPVSSAPARSWAQGGGGFVPPAGCGSSTEEPLPLRSMLEEHSRLLTEMQSHISSFLNKDGGSASAGSAGNSPGGRSAADLKAHGAAPNRSAVLALGKHLFSLQRATTDVLERLLAPASAGATAGLSAPAEEQPVSVGTVVRFGNLTKWSG